MLPDWLRFLIGASLMMTVLGDVIMFSRRTEGMDGKNLLFFVARGVLAMWMIAAGTGAFQ